MSLLEKHFDVAFAASDGIKKLRELIFTLAMQGKLVPQDPNDEPASELLKLIEVEKKRLAREGKIKQYKPLPAIKTEEIPHALPNTWKWLRLGDFGIWKSGTTPSRTNSAYYGGEIPWVKSGEVKQGKIKETEETITHEALKNCSLVLNPIGSILIAMYGANIGDVGVLEIEATTNQAVCACKTYVSIDNIFLLYLVISLKQNFNAQGAGAAQSNISKEKIVNTVAPLPPFAEQRRIVAKIDQLMACCDELEKLRIDRSQRLITLHTAAIDRLLTAKDSTEFSTAWNFLTQHFGELYSAKENVAELRKTILQLAVMGKLAPQDPNDEPVDRLLTRILIEQKQLKSGKLKESQIQPLEYNIPSHWKWQCLDSILVYGPTNGFSPQAVDYETPVRSLTLSATTSGKFKGEHSKFIANEIPPDSNLWLRDGDILVQRGNTLEYVGVSAVYRGEPNCFIYPDLMMKLRVSSEIDTNFIYLVMSSEPCRNFLRSRASGTSGTMPKINQTTLKSLPIPLPPLAEQRRIVKKIDRLMGMCDRLKESIESAKDKQIQLLNTLISQV
jgi:type I restriction enzyme, S subunit